MTIERGIRRAMVVLSGLCLIAGGGYAYTILSDPPYRFIYAVITGAGERIEVDVDGNAPGSELQMIQGQLVLEGRADKELTDGAGKAFTLAYCHGDRTTICVASGRLAYLPLASRALRFLFCVAFGGAIAGVPWITFYILRWVIAGFVVAAR